MEPAASPVKVNWAAAPSGLVCFSTMIVPRLVLVKVQVTVSPAPRTIPLTGLPSVHEVPVRSQPARASSATEYVPGTSAPESFGVAASVSEKFVPLYEGSNSKLSGAPAGLVTLSIRMWPRLVLVKVQVTVSPAPRTIPLTGLPSVHEVPVRSQPARASSATEYVPGTRAPESFGVAASVSEKFVPLYDGSNSKLSGAPAGLVTLSIRMWPRLVLVKVQVTVSPAPRTIPLTGLPSVHEVPVRSQPARASSATEYVPGTRAPESFGVAASVSEKFVPLYDGSNSKLSGAPAGLVTLSIRMWPRLVLVKVQVTVSPAPRTIPLTGLPSVHEVPVRSQPARASSATEYVPGTRAPESFGVAASVSEKFVPLYEGSNSKLSGAPAGLVTLSIRMWPPLVLVKVQVTVSPAPRTIPLTGLPSVHEVPVRSQPARASSATEYVPGTRAPESFGVAASVSEKFVPLYEGSNSKLSGAPAGSVTLSIRMWPRLVLVKVQVTVSPAPRTIPLTGLPSVHEVPVRSQPARASSATEYVPGTRAPESFGVAASVSEKFVPLYEGSNSKLSGAPAGLVTLSMRMWPRLVLVKVQVTVSPAPSTIAVTGLPSAHEVPVRSQPARASSATEYVPGTRAPESFGVAASVSEKFVPLYEGSKSKLSGAAAGLVTLSMRMWPRLVLVKVQVTTSPADSVMLSGELPSSQVAPVRSQPARASSATEYVPGLRSPESCGAAASVRLKFEALHEGSNANEAASPAGFVTLSTKIRPAFVLT